MSILTSIQTPSEIFSYQFFFFLLKKHFCFWNEKNIHKAPEGRGNTFQIRLRSKFIASRDRSSSMLYNHEKREKPLDKKKKKKNSSIVPFMIYVIPY